MISINYCSIMSNTLLDILFQDIFDHNNEWVPTDNDSNMTIQLMQ